MIKKLEAILFSATEELKTSELAEILETTEKEVMQAIDDLNEMLESSGSALIVRENSSGWAMYTRPEVSDIVETYISSWDKRKLSASAVETLAIIAYTQPTTRSRINDIRGVNSDSLVTSLLNKGYVCEVGVDEDNNNAAMYGTTSQFLDKYGLKSIDDLPDLLDFAPDEETRFAIVARLSQSFSSSEEV